jgi:tetratricopeptide (TPR) repeat protein
MNKTGAWQRKGRGIVFILLVACAGAWPTFADEETSDAETAVTNAPAEVLDAPLIVSSPADSNAVAAASATNAPPPEPSISAEQAWKSFMQLQGQMDTALLAIERSRRERQIVEEQHQRQLEQRLRMIELSIDDQRLEEAKTMREANRNMLLVAGVFAGVGFLAMVLTSIFHFRAMNKLSVVVAALPMESGYGTTAALTAQEKRLLAAQSGRGEKGTRLLGAIERLEQRVHELEHTSHSPTAPDAGLGAPSNGQARSPNVESQDREAGEKPDARISMFLGKGQTLLNMGQAEKAITCFDDALAAQPGNAEAWIKKGAALEKLNRLSDAIECYDQAIAANEGMTLAYLYKGGVFNKMERYNEALSCYEKALQTQKAGVPVPAGVPPAG